MHDVGKMAVAMQAMVDQDDNGVECAMLLILDKHRVQKVSPLGGQSDLLLDVVRKHGLARIDRYSSLDTDTQAQLPGWELTVNPHSIATLRFPGSAGYLTKTRLVAADRWWSVAAERGTVTLLAVGGSTYARDLGAGSDVVAELDAAADHGVLLTAAVAFTRQQDNAAGDTSDWMNWPLHGLTIASQDGQFALNVSSATDGLLRSMPLAPDEVSPLAKALSRAVANSDVPVNVSEIVLAVTGRRLPPVGQ